LQPTGFGHAFEPSLHDDRASGSVKDKSSFHLAAALGARLRFFFHM
jgi:hypothetical protein